MKKLSLNKKHLVKNYREAVNNINRAVVSQLKYIYINNKDYYWDLFKSIGIALNSVTEPALVNKLILDINLVSKIKNVKFSQKLSSQLYEIKESMEIQTNAFEEKNILKTIVDWLYYGASMELFIRNQFDSHQSLRTAERELN